MPVHFDFALRTPCQTPTQRKPIGTWRKSKRKPILEELTMSDSDCAVALTIVNLANLLFAQEIQPHIIRPPADHLEMQTVR
jgi:hypothetical protein